MSGSKILVVDDEAYIVELVGLTEKEGFKVLEAFDGSTALNWWKTPA